MNFRSEVRASDEAAIREIVESTGFFHDHEVEIAVELVQERLEKGDRSGYFFVFGEDAGSTIGYACFGPIGCTVGSFDLYWIAVHRDRRGQGAGRDLLRKTEEAIAGMGGRRVYAETSSRDLYRPTHAFYLHSGYRLEATLEDFYAPGDSKLVFVKALV